MKKSTEKLISIFLTITMFIVSVSSACATEQCQPDTTSDSTLTDALSGEEDGFLYDGKTEVLLGTYTEAPTTLQALIALHHTDLLNMTVGKYTIRASPKSGYPYPDPTLLLALPEA